MTEHITLDQAADALSRTMRDAVRRHANLYLVQAALMIVAGAFALVYPVISTVAIAIVLGWMLIFAGIAQAIVLIGGTRMPHFWLQIISAVLSIIVGFLVIRNPAAGVGAIVLLMIVYFLLEGVAKIIFSLTVRPLSNWGWVLASGVLGVLFAGWLLSNPSLSLVALGVYVGIFFIAEGAAIGWMAWHARKRVAAKPADAA